MNTLQTPRLILRPWQASDADYLYEYAREPAVGPSAGWPPHTSVENSRQIIQNVLSVPETYALQLRSLGHPVGSVSIKLAGSSDLPLNDMEGEIGYWLGVPFWGQGLMPEAVEKVLEHGFMTLGLHTLWCGHFEENHKSKRVVEKMGFVYRFTQYNKPCPLLQCTHTCLWYAMTKEQWIKQRT